MRKMPAPVLSWWAATVLLVMGIVAQEARASSHREAPLIGNDPQADNTDVYAYVSPENPKMVVINTHFIPLQSPEAGPNFWYMGNNIRYDIHINNSGTTRKDITFRFQFSDRMTKKPESFLFNTGPVTSLGSPNLNVTQKYRFSILKRDARGFQREVWASDSGNRDLNPNKLKPRNFTLQVAPDYVGTASFTSPTPNGVSADQNYDNVAKQAIYVQNVQEKGSKKSYPMRVFVGRRSEQFYIDLGAAFDLLQLKAATPVNGTANKNVSEIALEIPKEFLTPDQSTPTDPNNENSVIGVWSTTSRLAMRYLPIHPRYGTNPEEIGPYAQVSRLANPLVNELLIPLGKKDLYNLSDPSMDVAQILPIIRDFPEPPRLLNQLFGVPLPPPPRRDLVNIFFTGFSKAETGSINLNSRPGWVTTPCELMRLNMAIPPTAPSDPKYSRLGVLGGDVGGYPNGRRPGDDVLDITLQAAAGAAFPNPTTKKPPFSDVAVKLTDGVDAPDVPFTNNFPFFARPHTGR